MEFNESRTYANLMAAFAGESQARNKYTFYSQAAKDEGYQQIGAIFEETADNEKEHAKLWLKWIHGGNIPGTLANLQDAANGEHTEWSEMYKTFADEARIEDYTEIASMFELIGSVEKTHEERYRKLIENIENGLVFQRDQVVLWRCRNCGYIHAGKTAPEMCPACKHPQSFYEITAENY